MATETSLQLIPTEHTGTMALAVMPEAEFEQRLAVLRLGQERIGRIKRELMKEDVHYGTIPHTPKPTLYQPGAQILCQIYSLRPDFRAEIILGDGITAPHLRMMVRCELHVGDLAGPIIAVGLGTANSWERKHRYRHGERTCPGCGFIGAIIKGREEYGGGWICYAKKGGCGAKFKEDDAAIIDQVAGEIENPDPYDLENTLTKMAEKRAFVNATLIGTASSDLFTQDIEDMTANAAASATKEKSATKAEPPLKQAQAKAEATTKKDGVEVDPQASQQAHDELSAQMRKARDAGDEAALSAIESHLVKKSHLFTNGHLTALRTLAGGCRAALSKGEGTLQK